MALRKEDVWQPPQAREPEFGGGGPGDGGWMPPSKTEWIVCAIDGDRVFCTQLTDRIHHAWLTPKPVPPTDGRWLLSCFVRGYFTPAWKAAGKPDDEDQQKAIWSRAVEDPAWIAARNGILSVISACDDAEWSASWSMQP